MYKIKIGYSNRLYSSPSCYASYKNKGMKFCHLAVQELDQIPQLFLVILKAITCPVERSNFLSMGSKENSAQIYSVQIAQVPGELKSHSYLFFVSAYFFQKILGVFFCCIFLSQIVTISLFIHHCSNWSRGLLNEDECAGHVPCPL